MHSYSLILGCNSTIELIRNKLERMAKKSNKVVRSNEPIIEVKFSKSKISKAVDAEIKTERSRLSMWIILKKNQRIFY